MKPTAETLSIPQTSSCPDFCRRPGRIKPGQMVAVKGLGKLILRPVRPDDEQEMAHFLQHISDENIYVRYFENLGLNRRTAHERLVGICPNTPESYALVVERPAAGLRPSMILAVGRLTRTPDPFVAAFETLMADEEQATKLAKVLLAQLIKVAHAFGFRGLTGELLAADHAVFNLCCALGFSLQSIPLDGLVRVALDLERNAACDNSRRNGHALF